MTVPYPFQRKGYVKIEKFKGRSLVSWEMGLGKTPLACFWARRNPEARPMIVICQAHLKWQWQREILLHMKEKAIILEGMTPYAFNKHRIIIINYDILGPWMPSLLALRAKLVVIDECQYIASLRAKRTRNVTRLCRKVKHILALSGTPLMNRPAELFPVLRILCPKTFKSFFQYGQRYCSPQLTPWGWTYNGATNLEELHRLLKRTCMIRALKKDVLKDLPDIRRIVVPMEIENRKEYNYALSDFIGWLSKISLKKARKAKKAIQISKLQYIIRLVAELKMKSVISWINDYLQDTDNKLILFGIHRKTIKILCEQYPGIHVMVDGSVTGRKRQERFDQFNSDPKIRLFIGNLQAAGTGWNCKVAADTAHFEIAWRPSDHTQAEGRGHGIGRGVEGRKVTSFYLVARNTLEERLCSIVQKKQETMDAVLDGKVGTDFSIYDQMLDILKGSQV